MRIIADLQLHSKFSRAVSKEMTIPNLALWAKKKGIGLIATGDWTHPKWFMEIERDLEEVGNGLLKLKPSVASGDENSNATALGRKQNLDPSSDLSIGAEVAKDAQGDENILDPLLAKDLPSIHEDSAKLGKRSSNILSPFALKDPFFLLASEVSCIYTQGGKGRRVHTLIWVPSLASARKINKEMTKQGCNLLSDGRPIIGLTSIQVAELVFTIEPNALVIPAHCLVPNAHILQDDFISKEIQTIKVGERVLTHKGITQVVTEVKKRSYKGDIVTIQPWYFRPGLTTTPEHPYYAIKTVKKCPSTGDICRPSVSHKALCKHKMYLEYKPTWIQAKDLSVGDVLVYPRSIPKKRVLKVSLNDNADKKKPETLTISAGGSRGRVINSILKLSPSLGRLLGYYLAEGSTDGNNSFSFCFSNKEKEYIDDVVALVQSEFQLDHPRIYLRNHTKSVEITFYSKIHAEWLARECYVDTVRRAFSKRIPRFLLQAEPIVQAECLRGWYRGDKGYTSSQTLMNQMKAMSLMLGIIPSIHIDTVEMHTKRGKHKFRDRIIQASHPSYSLTNFAFFSDIFELKKEIPRSHTKIDRKHGWIDDTNVYMPIKDRTITPYTGDVFNLEVEYDHSYVAEFATVHNCWTPWFSTYGSKSGFDSISDAFGPYAEKIYAAETGLSSNPAMNWCIPELDSRTILSFSDAHSLPKLGREATVFEFPDGELSYDGIYQAISQISITASGNKNFLDPLLAKGIPSINKDTAKLGKRSAKILSPSAQSFRIAYTIEFYPEEGKYHYTGHRSCNVRLSPEQTRRLGKTCSVCGKPLTEGVMDRVETLASLHADGKPVRTEENIGLYKKPIEGISVLGTYSKKFPDRPPFVMLVPLREIISECIGSPVASPKVSVKYDLLLEAFGTEFDVLLKISKEEIERIAGPRIAEGIEKVRTGDIVIDPGYDGVFGVVKLWKDDEDKPLIDTSKEQMGLLE